MNSWPLKLRLPDGCTATIGLECRPLSPSVTRLGDAIAFDLPPHEHAYLTSQRVAGFVKPPKKDLFGLLADAHYLLTGNVRLKGGEASLWIFEYDAESRVCHQTKRLLGGPFDLHWRTQPHHAACCFAIRLEGSGCLALRRWRLELKSDLTRSVSDLLQAGPGGYGGHDSERGCAEEHGARHAQMGAREIIRRTLAFDEPQRVARSFADSDFCTAPTVVQTPATDWRLIEGGRWQRIDEWGNTVERSDGQSEARVVSQAIGDVRDVEGYRLPDYSRPESYQKLRTVRAKYPDKYAYGRVPGFAFTVAAALCGADRYLSCLDREPHLTRSLHDLIDGMLEDIIRNHAAVGVDAVMLRDALGPDIATLIPLEAWQAEFFPRCEKLCQLAHACGMKVILQSRGQISSVVPSLIRAGVDIFQFDQPALYGIDVLRAYQETDKITLWCPVDIPAATAAVDESCIRGRARLLLDHLWRGRGGFIAGHCPDSASAGWNASWQDIANEELLTCGVRSRYAP